MQSSLALRAERWEQEGLLQMVKMALLHKMLEYRDIRSS